MSDRPGSCSTEIAIRCWITDRKSAPKPRAVRNKQSKMRGLFTYLDKPDDLTGVSYSDLQRYKDHLVKEEGNNHARDHLAEITALFGAAHANDKLPGGNPAERLRLPAKRAGVKRVPFTVDEARRLRDAACDHADPIIKWGTLLGADLGLITEEFADAVCRDVEFIDGIPCLHIRSDFRTIVGVDVNDLKTVSRTRTLPLPTRWVDSFLAYVDSVRRDYGANAALFAHIPIDRDGLRTVRASRDLMAFIRGLGITDDVDPAGKKTALRSFYSWRHRFCDLLENMKGENRPSADRQRAMCGHAAKDVHAAFYKTHPPHELRPIIDYVAATP